MNFPFYLASRITRNSQRTFSKLIVRVAVSTVAVGVAAMILAIAVLNGFKNEVSSKQRGFFGDITITGISSYNQWEQQPIYLDSTIQRSLLGIQGLEAIQYFATKPGIINVNGEIEGVVMKGIDAAYNQDFLRDQLLAGDVLDFGDSATLLNQALISKVTADRLGLGVGDDFLIYFVQEPIRRRKITIRGIYSTGARELDQTYIVGALPLINRLNDWTELQVGGYELLTSNFEQLDEITDQVQQQLPDGHLALHLKERFPEIFQWLDLLDANPQVILALMMIVAIINMISAMLIIILEKAQLIGILKALGFTNEGLRKVFIYHASYLLGLGLLIGNALALSLYWLQKTWKFIKLDEDSYYVSFVPVEIGWVEVAMINIGVVFIALLVLIIPAHLVTKINPIRTIQFR